MRGRLLTEHNTRKVEKTKQKMFFHLIFVVIQHFWRDTSISEVEVELKKIYILGGDSPVNLVLDLT